MKLINLKVEGISNPVGMDEKMPTFSWQILSDKGDTFQENFRIVVALSRDVESDIVWDSGTVSSQQSFDHLYNGKALLPCTKYYYRVFVTVNGKLLKSQISFFVTGMLSGKMEGEWLSPDCNGTNIPESCIYARKTFNTSEVDYATLYVYSYGWYEVYMNGEKPDDRILSPAKSTYESELLYDAYDVTKLLQSGKNALCLVLGDGYNVNANRYMGTFKGGKRFIANLNIHHTNGSITVISSDDSWKFTDNTPIIMNNIYNGEFYDATREIDGWKNSDFDDRGWKNLYPIKEKETLKLSCNIGPFIKIVERIKPKKIYTLKDGRYILDFGQNLAGFVEFSLKRERNDRIRIKTAEEIIEFNGEYILNVVTNRAAVSTDTYIFKGGEVETYHPSFTYHGFRYAEVSGIDRKPAKNEFCACVTHTEFSYIADFKTDNELINRIYSNAAWSVRSNSLSFPSDCAARDERTPCAMDLYTYINTAVYLLPPSVYYERFENLQLSVIKYVGKCSMTWSGCIIALPWYLHKYYGRLSVVKKHYSKLKRFEDYYLAQYPDLSPEGGFGDWCAPNCPGNYLTSFSDCEETEQYAMIISCRMMSDMANAIGKKSDAERYSSLAKQATKVYLERFYDNKKQIFSLGKQAPNVYALSESYLYEAKKESVGKNLLKTVNYYVNLLDVGIFGIRNFVEAFADLNAVDTALDCFMNPEYPSFANQIAQGATTLWEQWCGYGDMSSHNHAMFAGAVSGFFTRLAGVTPLSNAFGTIQIKPVLSKHISKLKMSFETVNGRVSVQYIKKENEFVLAVAGPPNLRAEIVMPNGQKHIVGNGSFNFVSDLTK